MNGMNPLQKPLITGKPQPDAASSRQTQIPAQSFGQMLNQSISAQQAKSLTFSKHAQARTEQRGISLSQADIEKLDGALEKAVAKGLGDTLIYMDNTAYIVNARSRVVVTVVDSAEAANTVFTNIDGAVIV